MSEISKYDWIVIGLVIITLYQIWLNFFYDNNNKFSLKEGLSNISKLCLFLIGFYGITYTIQMANQTSVPFKKIFHILIALGCGILYFTNQNNIKDKDTNFLSKIIDYVCLLLFSLFIILMVFALLESIT